MTGLVWQEVWQMNHGTNAAVRPSWRAARRPGPLRRRPAATAVVLLTGCLTSVGVTTLAGAPRARAGTAPPPPGGRTTGVRATFPAPARAPPGAANLARH